MFVPSRSRSRRVASTLGVALLLAIALPSMVFAETVENLTARATNANSWSMVCTPNTTDVTCTRNIRIAAWAMQIKPAKGPIDSVVTGAQKAALPLDSTSISWMTDMHQFACGDPKTWDAFVTQVGSFTKPGTEITKTIGTCSAVGGLYGGNTAPTIYRVVSTQLPPPTPAPTPTTGPSATPKPTPAPTHTPHPSATPVAIASPSSTIEPAPSASPSLLPTEAPLASASPAATAIVAGEQTGPPTPGPTSGVGAGPGEPTPAPTP
ncbi:MAG TPA: hypothetical protein VJ850_01625, partial [Candidatus Limnocylindrales bacterium]|nr:hypothetical protein [Candidatus Limnocylindrales bacterium]